MIDNVLRRSGARWLAGAVVGGVTFTTLTPAAHAITPISPPVSAKATRGDGTVSCRGGRATWTADPGISFNSGDATNTVVADVDLGQCTAGNYPDLTGGKVTLQATGRAWCPIGLTNGNATATIQWNNGKASTVTGTLRVTAGSFGLTDGRITSGLFDSYRAQFIGHPQENWAACIWGVGHGEATIDIFGLTPATD